MLYLNTDFAGPQLRDVCEREGILLLVHDEEYTELVARGRGRKRTVAGVDRVRRPGPPARTHQRTHSRH